MQKVVCVDPLQNHLSFVLCYLKYLCMVFEGKHRHQPRRMGPKLHWRVLWNRECECVGFSDTDDGPSEPQFRTATEGLRCCPNASVTAKSGET